jgi:hypothetical protein
LSTIDSLKLMSFIVPTWHYSQSIGWANYNALEAKFQKRWSNGLNMLLNYTWSKTLDTSSGWFAAENGTGGGAVVQNYFTPKLNYGPSAYNIPQLLTWGTSYELPVGRGKQFLTHGPLSWMLGNWEMNYTFLIRSGQPFNLNVNGDVANIAGNGGSLSGYSRPNLAGNPSNACTIAGATVPTGTAACFYNPAAFSIPSGSFGNFGKDALHGEHLVNADVSLVKRFPLGESRYFQLRFEAFNVFNFQVLAIPAGTTIGLTNAGLVQNIASVPRQLQFGAKFTF